MTLDQIERKLERLRSRLYRTVNAINLLEKAKKRIKRRMELEYAEAPKEAKESPEPVAQSKESKAVAKDVGPAVNPEAVALQALTGVDETLDIKEQPWIKSTARGNLTEADKATIANIEAAQAERKAAKTAARIAKLKADKAGDRKKMPLTGKAALAAINQ
jgi:hypothetical protein